MITDVGRQLSHLLLQVVLVSAPLILAFPRRFRLGALLVAAAARRVITVGHEGQLAFLVWRRRVEGIAAVSSMMSRLQASGVKLGRASITHIVLPLLLLVLRLEDGVVEHGAEGAMRS